MKSNYTNKLIKLKKKRNYFWGFLYLLIFMRELNEIKTLINPNSSFYLFIKKSIKL